MSVLSNIVSEGFEQVMFCHDRHTGLHSIIAIHDTTLGPALGGVRMWPYADEQEALLDCMRLARGMTFKAAAAGVNLGGGKSVIIGDSNSNKNEAVLRAHGRFIQSLHGRYIPGIDIGTNMSDMETIALEADRVSCVRHDPSPMTALGVLEGIRACIEYRRGTDSLDGVKVAIQGAGHVGSSLARQLLDAGAEVVLSDVDERRAQEVAHALNIEQVDARELMSTHCDVLAPCALGGVINDDTLRTLDCEIIAGSANNVLASPCDGEALHDRGILYAPDYCINAGGLVFLEEEILCHDGDRAERRVRDVRQLVSHVLARSARAGISTARAAEHIANERLNSLGSVGPAYVR